MTNLSNLSPVAVDTIYVERLSALESARFYARRAADDLICRFGREVYVADIGSKRGYPKCVRIHPDSPIPAGDGGYHFPLASLNGIEPLKAVQVVEAFAAGHPKAARLADAVADLEEASARLTDACLAVEEVEAEYASRPWSRFWLVTTSNGHIHRSTHCSTCNRRGRPTGFALVPYLSGQTAADAVADLGPALCSVCFPEAPVESKEVSTIPARLALALKEQGSEAFQKARKAAVEKAKAKAADRCPGGGERVEVGKHGYVKCPSCGWSGRSFTGKVAAHRRPRFYAVRNDKFWTGTGWGPSTKKIAFESREAALAIEGATEARKN